MDLITVDIEADGLLEDAGRIHCICMVRHSDGKLLHFADKQFDDTWAGTINDGVSYLETEHPHRLLFHNGLGYDLPLLEKLYPGFEARFKQGELLYYDTGKILDTLLLSRLINQDMPILAGSKSAHSVENYGKYFKRKKPTHEDWTAYTPEMLYRCQQDVLIQQEIYNFLERKAAGWDYRAASRLEHELTEICNVIERTGWRIDLDKCIGYERQLEQEMQELAAEIQGELHLIPKKGGDLNNVLKKDGSLTHHAINWINRENIPPDMWPSGPLCRINWERLDLGSSEQVKKMLLSQGWRPREYNLKKVKNNWGKMEVYRDPETRQPVETSPKLSVDCPSLDELESKVGRNAALYIQKRHRLSLIKGFIKNEKNGLLHVGINTMGTVTGRCSHYGIVNIPGDGKYFGDELRSLFMARPGCTLVGVDISALESFIEGHACWDYPGGKEHAHDKVTCEDLHQRTADLFKTYRKKGKEINYALPYGCGIKKLSRILDTDFDSAKVAYDEYWNQQPALKALKLDLEEYNKNHKFIVSLDNRKILNPKPHCLVNWKLQGDGAILAKKWVVLLYRGLYEAGLMNHVNLLGFYHDEVQAEVEKGYENQYKELALKCLTEAGKYYKLKLEMGGEAKEGSTWADTH